MSVSVVLKLPLHWKAHGRIGWRPSYLVQVNLLFNLVADIYANPLVIINQYFIFIIIIIVIICTRLHLKGLLKKHLGPIDEARCDSGQEKPKTVPGSRGPTSAYENPGFCSPHCSSAQCLAANRQVELIR